jgi:hypothetical protein
MPQERVQAKLRRQRGVVEEETDPKKYSDSLKIEKKKQEKLKKTKDQRREALCEELGRGC